MVAAAAAALLLTACLGDPPPDPATAPLEVVVGGAQQPDEPCLLNRNEVAAGEHEVSVIAEAAGPAGVVLRDPTGAVVFESEAGASEAAPAPVALSPGEHVVQCLVDGQVVGEVPLEVVAAGS